MDEELSRKKMMSQVESLRESPLYERVGLEVEVNDFDVFIQMPMPDETLYELKVNFDNHPQQAPSYRFIDDWPNNARGIDENRGGICIDGTRECYNEYSHDEREDDWDPEKYDLVTMVHKIYGLVRRG